MSNILLLSKRAFTQIGRSRQKRNLPAVLVTTGPDQVYSWRLLGHYCFIMHHQYSFDSLHDYRIEIASHFDMKLPEWIDEDTVSILFDSYNGNITTFTGTFDQAGLIGLLRCLYYLGLPLVSVYNIKSD